MPGLLLAVSARAFSDPGALVAHIPFAVPSPQDIAWDPGDGTFWVTTFLDGSIYHLSSDLSEVIEVFPSPFGTGRFLTGIAFDWRNRTILATDCLAGKILELRTEGPERGQPTGREIVPQWDLDAESSVQPFALGMAYDPYGDEGRGSLYLVESSTSLVYEIDLEGACIRRFPHPDDPDGFPGEGLRAPSCYDVEPIFDGSRLVGLYLTGGLGDGGSIRRVHPDGTDTGIWIPLDEAGGTAGGILRRDFRPPGAAGSLDAFVCVVQSSARFAVLEGGDPAFREIVGFQCAVKGNEISLAWSVPEPYDRIEIVEGCSVLETLPGTATSWRRVFEEEGVHEVRLRAHKGDRSSDPPPCRIVVGAGEVISARDISMETDEGTLLPVDIETDARGYVLVSANLISAGRIRGRILVCDRELNLLSALDVPEVFAKEEDYVTGIACDMRSEHGFVYLFNASTSEVAVLDEVAALVETFPAQLPNLEEDPEKEPDLGLVLSMDFDPSGDGGRGSLWVVEAVRDWVYELDLRGQVLRSFPHPYLAVEPTPPDFPYGIPSSGVSLPPWADPDELYLGGGALRDPGQVHIVGVDKETGLAMPETAVPTEAIAAYGSKYSFAFDGLLERGEASWAVLARGRRKAWLIRIRAGPPKAPPPAFVSARQPDHRNRVELRFQSAARYERLEIARDCEPFDVLRNPAARWVDREVPFGEHEYRIRGIVSGPDGEVASPWVSAKVWVGPGAILRQRFLWPAESPFQLTRDPVNGEFLVATNKPGDERTLHFFSKDFRYLESREIAVTEPWQIATLAVRRPAGSGREIYYITWQQPVPLGQADAQQFFFASELPDGLLSGLYEIRPPKPRQGFLTFPTGLVWNPNTDTFLYLERNSATFVEIDPSGQTLREFPHPDPPFQNFVFGLGVAVAPERTELDPRGTVFFTTAGRRDHRITLLREMTFDGTLTGFELPLGHVPQDITGIALDRLDLVAVGTGAFSEALWIQLYLPDELPFVRGDANGDGVVNLTDAVVTLEHLFRGGAEPPCLDAADADDSGRLNLTDAVATLRTLFAGAGPLPPPYPSAGLDPSDDDFFCE